MIHCVKADLIRALEVGQGVSVYPGLTDVLDNRVIKIYRERDQVENDPTYKQVVTYTVVGFDGKVLSYRRRTGDDRLTGLKSIGIGGHVEDRDEDIRFAAERELEEEIGMYSGGWGNNVLTINDDSDDVGLHHIGVVQYVKLIAYDPDFEDSIIDPELVCLEDVDISEYESWSQLLIEYLSNSDVERIFDTPQWR